MRLALRGVDDPHIRRDRYDQVAGGRGDRRRPLARCRPRARTSASLDAFTADGYPLVLAGHTHGGQLCIPFYGALVTNCDLTPRAPRACPPAAPGTTPTCTSPPGCGTTRYAPVRFACPPGGHPAHPDRAPPPDAPGASRDCRFGRRSGLDGYASRRCIGV